MRKHFNRHLNKSRIRPPAIPEAYASDDSMGPNGLFAIMYRPDKGKQGVLLKVMASEGEPGGMIPWEHVSISLPDRTPTWEEMCFVKDLFWDPEETVLQYHPPQSEYVNNHNYCLHLWRPLDVIIPRPPAIAVGVAKQPQERTISQDLVDQAFKEVCGGHNANG